MRTTNQVIDIPLGTREEIIEADNVMAGFQQAIAKMGANKTGAPGDQNRFAFKHATVCLHGAHSTRLLWGSAPARQFTHGYRTLGEAAHPNTYERGSRRRTRIGVGSTKRAFVPMDWRVAHPSHA